MSNDDEVGYGKPPRHTQFKPGQSGNPKGRSKGTKNLKTDLMEELRERIPIKESGQAKIVSKQRAMLKALMAKAVQGDTRAANVVIGMVFKLFNDEQAPTDGNELNASDQAVLEEFANQILDTKKANSKAKVNGRRKKNA